jgi:hypothetical protein
MIMFGGPPIPMVSRAMLAGSDAASTSCSEETISRSPIGWGSPYV